MKNWIFVLQESEIMTISESAVYPLYVGCNFLLHTPNAAAADNDDDDAARQTR